MLGLSHSWQKDGRQKDAVEGVRIETLMRSATRLEVRQLSERRGVRLGVAETLCVAMPALED